MKLLAHYNRVNLITTVVVLFLTGIIYYQAISFILNHQVDKDIRTEETETFDYIKEHHKLPEAIDAKDQKVEYKAIAQPLKRQFINTNFYNKKERENEAGRALITSATLNGQNYQITITESKVETEDLIRIVFVITLGVTLLLLFILLLVNRFVLNTLWKPFYNMLHQLRMFSLSDDNEIVLSTSNIDEFEELNSAVTQMSARVKTDYRDLKAFTENASHELLTPIAVINSKLDSLIQSGDYTEQQSKLLDDVYGAVSRLTRLNQSLLLLVKIENGLHHDEQPIDLKPLILEKIAEFKELFAEKDLKFDCELQDKQITASKYLIEVLLNNLISNAMRHNHPQGEIRISLTPESLTIKNTGEQGMLRESDIFKRFNKSSGSEGTGLGLTITKQICDNYSYKLSYSYELPYHRFTIAFN